MIHFGSFSWQFSVYFKEWTRVPFKGEISPRAGALLFHSIPSDSVYLYGGFSGIGGTEVFFGKFFCFFVPLYSKDLFYVLACS